MQMDQVNKTLKEVLPASSETPGSSSKIAPLISSKTPPATQFAAAWQNKLGQLPDPTKNGVMNSGVVGQVFLYTDKYTAADITGSLTVVANDATDRPNGQAPRQPNVWHFDAATLKRMVVNDDRFGKSVALFLPWPEEWIDVNRLYIQARYDQPNSYTIYAPPATVTLDFSTTAQTIHSASKLTGSQMSIPDPKLLMQNAKGPTSQNGMNGLNGMNGSVGIQQASYAANWPSNLGSTPPAITAPNMSSNMGTNLAQPGMAAPPSNPQHQVQPMTGLPGNFPPATNPPIDQPREYQRTVIPRR